MLGKVDDVIGNIYEPHYTINIDGYIKKKFENNKLNLDAEVYICQVGDKNNPNS
jgi:rRNA processing protein Gar1